MTAAMKLKDICSLEKNYDKLRQHIKKQRHHFAQKGESESHSVVSNSLQPHGLYSPWNSPG